jgi:spermidine/putrescine transport system permease protein
MVSWRSRLVLSIAPLVLTLATLFYAPTLALVYYSFYDRFRGALTVEFYLDVLLNPLYANVIIYSLNIAVITVLATLALTLPVAAYMTLYSRGLERVVLLVVFTTPFWIDFLLRAWALKSLLYMLGVREGFLALILGMIYDYIPFMLLPIYASLARMPPNIVYAARTLGAGALDLWARIIVPYALPGILVGSTLVLLMSLTELVIPTLLGGVRGFTLGPLIYTLILAGDEWGRGAALAIIVTVLSVLTAILAYRRFRGLMF